MVVQENILYTIAHQPSESLAVVKCKLNKQKQPQLESVHLLAGNVVSLHDVRQVLQQFGRKHISPPEPPTKRA